MLNNIDLDATSMPDYINVNSEALRACLTLIKEYKELLDDCESLSTKIVNVARDSGWDDGKMDELEEILTNINKSQKVVSETLVGTSDSIKKIIQIIEEYNEAHL